MSLLGISDDPILNTSLAAAVVYGILVTKQPSVPRFLAKTTSTALLAFITSTYNNSRLLAGALTLGSIGDGFLACGDGDPAFLGGLGSFLAGHMMYVAHYLKTGLGPQQIFADNKRMAVAGAFTLFISPIMNILLMPRVKPELRVPIFLYCTVSVCVILAVLTAKSEQVVDGAIRFALSDVVLAIDKFLVPPTSPLRPWLQTATWILYYSGQKMITSGSQS